MTAIRYSKAFKLQAVREVESGQNCAWAVSAEVWDQRDYAR